MSSFISNILSGVLGVASDLTTTQQNGLSQYGILPTQNISSFLTNNPIVDGTPWGSLTATQNNPYTSAPNTGVIRPYDFTISRGQIAPDGYQKDVILINGQFPGPLIEANWGDTIQVTVRNSIQNPPEGTALHWHGLTQMKTPWYDGVAGIQQCPIAPGSAFTYSFQADLYGTSWYHSHYSGQAAGGLFGPMVIHGPIDTTYDIDIGPVLLSDWYHTEYFKILQGVMAKNTSAEFNIFPTSDNNLINGKMKFSCSTKAAGDNTPCNDDAGLSKFSFVPGLTHRLRLINAGGEGIQRFSIDGHKMTVIANDFVPVVPYETDVVTLGVGQRADILVTAAGPAGSAYWMRSNLSTICGFSKQPYALAAIYYQGADTTQAPNSISTAPQDPGTCANDDISRTVPLYPIAADEPDTTIHMSIDFFFNKSGNALWKLGTNSFRTDYNDPVLLEADKGNFSYPPDWNVYNVGTNKTVRIVLQNGAIPAAHPMHLHGHNFQVIADGDGTWDGSTIVNGNNPQRRDTQIVRPKGYSVLQYNTDNPGVWPFHCHIIWHVSAGLFASMMEQPESLAQDTSLPMVMQQTCKTWQTYTALAVPNQIDSGV